MKRLIAVAAALLAFPASASAVTLVNQNGQPVGGTYQRWVNAAKVPTIHGWLVFSTNRSVCGGPIAAGCSTPVWTNGWPWTMAASRFALYYELGHQFDWKVLTNRERHHLAALWGVPHATWADSTASVAAYTEDGLESDFAAAYADCAAGMAVNGLASGTAPAITLQPEARTCNYIRRLG